MKRKLEIEPSSDVQGTSTRYKSLPQTSWLVVVLANFLNLRNPAKQKSLETFFKTQEGAYGHGDQFLGITMPHIRQFLDDNSALLVKQLPLETVAKVLIRSAFHEVRMLGVLALVARYEEATDIRAKKEVVDIYLFNSAWVNNWDLVDASATKIVGHYLYTNEADMDISSFLMTVFRDKHPQITDALLLPPNRAFASVWAKRIAILATFYGVRQGQFQHLQKLAEAVIEDQSTPNDASTHDLIHKATGWILREMGKVKQSALIEFLTKHASRMPRVMLRYALEKLTPAQRSKFLNMKD